VLGHVAGEHAAIREWAIQRLIHQARADRSQEVRSAVCHALLGLGWPKTDEDWAKIKGMGAGALCFLSHMVRGGEAERREKALVLARELTGGLLADAERQVDHAAIVLGLELQWDMDFARRRQEVLELGRKGQLEHASAVFGEAQTECETVEKRVQTIIVQSGLWPGDHVANKWRQLHGLLMDDGLAHLREAWPLTIGTWRTKLEKRGEDAETWRETFERASAVAETAQRLRLLDEFMKQHPESFYTQFAWKWKDVLRTKASAP
jgi:hypothetical protein